MFMFRIDRGEIMLHTSEQDIARYKNRHHFSKETIIVLPSAHAVPLGSPLVVGLSRSLTPNCSLSRSYCSNVSFSGYLPFNNTLVAGFWHIHKDNGPLFECRATHTSPKSENQWGIHCWTTDHAMVDLGNWINSWVNCVPLWVYF